MHEVLVNRLGGLSLPRKSVVRLTDRPDMTLDVNCGRKTTIQQPLTGVVLLVKTTFFTLVTMFNVLLMMGTEMEWETRELSG